MTAFKKGQARIGKLLALGERDVLISDLDANDVITLDVSGPATKESIILRLENGLSLSGIKIVDGTRELTGEFLRGIVLILISENTSIIINEDVAVPAINRFAAKPFAAFIGIDERQVFLIYSVTESRWIMPNWNHFDPEDPSTWNPVPTTTTEAINQLGSRAPLTFEGSFASTSGVAFTLWSFTLAERQVIGGRLAITAGYTTGGVTSRSRGFIDFGGSRSPGGAAVITNNNSAENGTLAAGTIGVAASGNDVLIQITYSVTGTIPYKCTLTYEVVDT